jgi:hypothetical protein
MTEVIHQIPPEDRPKNPYIPPGPPAKRAEEEIICPFCNEHDFDLIGLKNHLISGHCNVFNETISIKEEVRI